MSKSEFEEFVTSGELHKFLNQDEDNLTLEELEFKYEVIKRAKSRQNSNKFLIAMSAIDRHYFQKEDNLKEKDILIFSKALEVVDVNRKLCNSIEFYLKKQMQKKENKNKEIVIKKHEEIEVKRLDVKEQNKIYREIMSMYDIDLNLAIKPLNLEEIIYLVSLMKKINISDKEILLAIKNIYKSFTSTYTNPLYEFNVYYEKMNYLSDNEEVKNAINYIKEIIPLILMPDDNKSYSEWMGEISKTIADIKPILNENYEYELEKGKSL
jgi:hypothetical protein